MEIENLVDLTKFPFDESDPEWTDFAEIIRVFKDGAQATVQNKNGLPFRYRLSKFKRRVKWGLA